VGFYYLYADLYFQIGCVVSCGRLFPSEKDGPKKGVKYDDYLFFIIIIFF
jgi:hypothetical protein